METRAKKLYGVIREVRTCFNHIKAVANEMHGDLKITASMRAVLESLEVTGERTVPDIARSKGVSRQHIQKIVNTLSAAELVAVNDNPGDKRTSLVSLTERGRESFREMKLRESAMLNSLGGMFPSDDMETTITTLRALTASLKRQKT